MLSVKKTSFNKKALSEMTFKEFESIYKGKFPSDVDLKKLFKANGGDVTKK